MRMGKPPGLIAWPRRWVRGVAGQDVTVAQKKKPDPPSLRENVKLCKASPSVLSQEAWKGWTIVMLICHMWKLRLRRVKNSPGPCAGSCRVRVVSRG